MHGDALAVPRRQLLAPLRLVGNELDHVTQPPGIDRVRLERVAVNYVVRGRLDRARRPEELEQHLLGVAVCRMRELGDKGLYRESVRNIRHRPEPADARMRLGLAD